MNLRPLVVRYLSRWTAELRRRVSRAPAEPASPRAVPVLPRRSRPAEGKASAVRRAALAAASVLVLAALLAYAPSEPVPELRPGDVAPRTIKAPRDFVDRAATEARRREAMAAVPDVYTQDPAVAAAVEQDLRTAFAQVRALQAEWAAQAQGGAWGEGASGAAPAPGSPAGPAPEAEWAARLAARLQLRLTDEVALSVLRASPRTLAVMEQGAVDVARSLLAEGIKPEALEGARRRVAEAVQALELERPYAAFVSLLVQSRLRPNLFFDREATEAARRQAAAQVEPVVVKHNQVIVREGEVVRPEQVERLRQAGLWSPGRGAARGAGALVLAVLAVALMAAYLYRFEPRLYQDNARLAALAVAGLAALGLTRALAEVPYLTLAAPLPAGAMMASLLLGPRVGLVYLALAAPLGSLMAGGQPELALAAAAGGGAGVLAVARVGGRLDLVRAGLAVSAAAVAVVAAVRLLAGELQPLSPTFWTAAGAAAAGGVLSAILTLGSLPYLEAAFGLLTPVRLLELANPHHPLLRRLLREAPGTYHHSLMVASLAEAAAERVGADPLLARVGSYYHDVGKLKRPAFFIENQLGRHNPHQRLSPHLSARIIIAHVRDGLELARQYRLPREIVRFIEEHHGTTRVEYFLRKAEEAAGPQGVPEEHFRYPGPVPQSKETALCMLADGCEAAVRALAQPTPARIEATVRKVIRDRLQEGQLDRCELTLRDLDEIARAFVQVLCGVLHPRIEYPEGSPAARGAGRPAAASRRDKAAGVE